jgi:hypothetical protein
MSGSNKNHDVLKSISAVLSATPKKINYAQNKNKPDSNSNAVVCDRTQFFMQRSISTQKTHESNAMLNKMNISQENNLSVESRDTLDNKHNMTANNISKNYSENSLGALRKKISAFQARESFSSEFVFPTSESSKHNDEKEITAPMHSANNIESKQTAKSDNKSEDYDINIKSMLSEAIELWLNKNHIKLLHDVVTAAISAKLESALNDSVEFQEVIKKILKTD